MNLKNERRTKAIRKVAGTVYHKSKSERAYLALRLLVYLFVYVCDEMLCF